MSFNSRDPAGRDFDLGHETVQFVVSTHATLRVATGFVDVTTCSVTSFNSRDPAGRDCVVSAKLPTIRRFNSRDPAGRDPIRRASTAPFVSFNSRDPAGRDEELP